MRAWQRMLSGRRLDLINPEPPDIEIIDIAHGLARVARWNGQTTGDHAFSVAQHSLLVENILCQTNECVSTQDSLAALLHDAPEYVIGDMISPFKNALNGNANIRYSDFEERLQSAIHLRFGLSATIDPGLKICIKQADKIAAWLEATSLAGFSEDEALSVFGSRPDLPQTPDLTPLAPEECKFLFLKRFKMLYTSSHKS